MVKSGTVILIHAHFLHPEEWQKTMWGDPKAGVFGVISKGFDLARSENADAIYLCSGIPKIGGRDFSPDAWNFAQTRIDDMPHLTMLPLHQDNGAQTTVEEIVNASKWCHDRGNVKRIIHVSVPKHILRAQQEMLIAKAKGMFKGIEIFSVASDVDFTLAQVQDVAMIEPSHRHDTPPWNAHKYVRAMINLLRGGNPGKFENFLTDLGELLRRYNIPVDWAPLEKR